MRPRALYAVNLAGIGADDRCMDFDGWTLRWVAAPCVVAVLSFAHMVFDFAQRV